MITILANAGPMQEEAAPHREESDRPTWSNAEPAAEWEMAVGPRQIAGIAFVATVALVVFSSVAYLAGKSTTEPAVSLRAPEIQFPKPAPPTVALDRSPLFVSPIAGKWYIQIAAAEKSVAIVVAEGLRSHGLDALVAPGTDAKVLRVLVGPVEEGPPYYLLKADLEKLGLSTFPHKE